MTDAKQLRQYFTPAWAARALFRTFFGDLAPGSSVFEPTCGDGRLLDAIPRAFHAWGVEIDPDQAERARSRTGRPVVVGDVLRVEWEHPIDAVFANPPFISDFWSRFLDRLAPSVSDGTPCGAIIPAYFCQAPTAVLRWNRSWSLSCELIPRSLFPGLTAPLLFALFIKDPKPTLRGLRLYAEAEAIASLSPEARDELTNGRGLWRPVVAAALRALGGRASLSELYHAIGGNRPSANPYWREKVRQTLQRGPFAALGAGVWQLADLAGDSRPVQTDFLDAVPA